MSTLKMIKVHARRKFRHFLQSPIRTLFDMIFLLNRFRTTDAYLMGFPKTGNTWTRFMLGSYLKSYCDLGYTPLFENYDFFGRCERHPIGPAIISSHGPLEWTAQTMDDLTKRNVVLYYRGKKVVLLVRHPLDALVSAWFHASTNGYHGAYYRDGLDNFFCDPIWGIDKYFRFYQCWEEAHQNTHCLLVRYEDTMRNPAEQLSRILRFLEIPIADKHIEIAIQNSSFSQMQKMELLKNDNDDSLKHSTLFNRGEGSSRDSMRVRKGKVGGYKDYLTSSFWRLYAERVKREMPEWYGY